jgi:hypothetical protein
MEKVQPNTTQIPHIIIRQWMPKLKDVELRVLLVITDQTLGWIEDYETGRRKEKDWISRSQLMKKTGRGHTKVTEAISTLVDKYEIVEALNEQEEPLDTPEKRKNCGMRIYYRLSLRPPQQTLFDKKNKPRGRHFKKEATSPQSGHVKKWTGQKVDTTKETLNTTKDTPYREQAQNPNQYLFKAFRDITGQSPPDAGQDRLKYPRLIRGKWKDEAVVVEAIRWAWDLKSKEGFFYWRENRLSLAKLYHRILPEFTQKIKASENLKKLSVMKRSALFKTMVSPAEKSKMMEEVAAEDRLSRR